MKQVTAKHSMVMQDVIQVICSPLRPNGFEMVCQSVFFLSTGHGALSVHNRLSEFGMLNEFVTF